MIENTMMTIPKQEKKNDNDTAAKDRVPLSFPQRVSILFYAEGRIMMRSSIGIQ